MKRLYLIALTSIVALVVMLLYNYHSANPFVVAYLKNSSKLDKVAFDIQIDGNTVFSTIVDSRPDVQVEEEVFARMPRGKYSLSISAGEEHYIDTLNHFGNSYLYISFINYDTSSYRIAVMQSKTSLPLE
jgi:hypothetical protein